MREIGIERTLHVGEPPAEAQQRFMAHFTTWMAQGGYRAEMAMPGASCYRKIGLGSVRRVEHRPPHCRLNG